MAEAKGRGLTIKRMGARDCRAAGEFSNRALTWMWERYLNGTYPKEARDYDIWHWSAGRMAVMLKDPHFFGFVAALESKICGLVVGTLYGKSGFAMINWIAVAPEHQHEGIGVKLMTATEEFLRENGCHKMSAYAQPELTPAVRLCMKFGLLPEASLRHQWWGADFMVMSKWLGKYKKH